MSSEKGGLSVNPTGTDSNDVVVGNYNSLADSNDQQIEEVNKANDPKRKYGMADLPKPVFFIIAMELCERFAYYGLRSLLTKYLKDPKGAGFSENTAKGIYSYFTGVAYFTPILGGIVADAFAGKFKTIAIFATVYIMGMITISLSALENIEWAIFAALALIALGTGGIKPCVGPFGGEQLRSDNPSLISTYFHVFYFTINLGSVFSTLLMPVIRQRYGYALAFCIPASLLALAMIIFFLGKSYYHLTPPSESVLLTMVKVVGAARKNAKSPEGINCDKTTLINYDRKKVVPQKDGTELLVEDTEPHWLDYAKLTKDHQDVEDTKRVWGLLPVFCVLPAFWMLFDQQGSSWVLQADKMDRNVFGVKILSEQVQALNACFILLCVPVFDGLIYPFFKRRGFKCTHLGRMLVGMFFACASYFFAAWNDWSIKEQGEGVVPIYRQLPQYLIITIAEVLISVTGLDFCYSQAPKRAKATVQSLYLLTTAIGDTISGTLFTSLPLSPFYFSVLSAGIMGFNILIFFFVTNWYNNNIACYVDTTLNEDGTPKEGTGSGPSDTLLNKSEVKDSSE